MESREVDHDTMQGQTGNDNPEGKVTYMFSVQGITCAQL
jgi:hypothetical protein